MKLEFSIAAESVGRLDRFLADQLAISRTQAARLIADKAVQVNGTLARASRALARGDEVGVAGAGRESRPGPSDRPRSPSPWSSRTSTCW
jgi:RNA-binding protein YlmH